MLVARAAACRPACSEVVAGAREQRGVDPCTSRAQLLAEVRRAAGGVKAALQGVSGRGPLDRELEDVLAQDQRRFSATKLAQPKHAAAAVAQASDLDGDVERSDD